MTIQDLVTSSAKIALVGDLHGHWDDWDVDWFNESDYQLILFTGDLGSGTGAAGVKVARSIARLAKRALVMPGNNDVRFQPAIAAEFAHQRGLIELLSAGPRERSRTLHRAAGQVEPCGYSLHAISIGGRAMTLLAGRPHSMGGPELSFVEELERNHGVATMAASTERLLKLVEDAQTDELIVLSHNGPYGLGGRPTDLWGCDFSGGAGDWGDPDLAPAIEHARKVGKRVLAVVGGHMHLRTRHREERDSRGERAGMLYVNPARVPRITVARAGTVRSHFCLELDAGGVRATEVLVEAPC